MQKSARWKYHIIVLIGTGFLNEAKPFSLFNAAQILSIGRCSMVWKAFSLKSSILALNNLRRVLSDFFGKGSQIGTQAPTGVFWCGDYTWGTEILKGIWGNKIIVLIVLIGTLYLNEAMSFSLFNATQIVSIRFEKPGENSGNYLAVTKILQNFIEKSIDKCIFLQYNSYNK